MAEINIQPKKQSPWPYILGVVAVLLIIFLVYRMQSGEPAQKTSTFFQDSTNLKRAAGDSLNLTRDTVKTDTTKQRSR